MLDLDVMVLPEWHSAVRLSFESIEPVWSPELVVTFVDFDVSVLVVELL